MIRVRGMWKVDEVNGFLINFFNTDTRARYIIFDPTDAMLPTSLVNPAAPWPLDDDLALSIKHRFLQPHFQRYVRVVNNDLPYFAIVMDYLEALRVRHKVHNVNSLTEAQAFIEAHQQATGLA